MAHALQWFQVGSGDNEASLTLVAGAKVSGKVVDDHGAPVAGARVVYSGASDWSLQADERHDAAVSAADGGFSFEALPAGSFRFVATQDDLAPGTSTLVTLDGTTERTGVTITMAAGAVVRGRVVDANKQPVPSARVRIGLALRTMIVAPPRQAFTDAQGAFELKGLPRRELVAVAINEAAASQSVPVDATRGDVGDVTLVLDVTGTIAGIVVDPSGQPVEGVQVSAGPELPRRRGGARSGELAPARVPAGADRRRRPIHADRARAGELPGVGRARARREPWPAQLRRAARRRTPGSRICGS